MQARERQVAAAIAVMRAGAVRRILGRMNAHRDRLRDVVDAGIEALDEGLDGRALATRANPFHCKSTSASFRTQAELTRRPRFEQPTGSRP